MDKCFSGYKSLNFYLKYPIYYVDFPKVRMKS